MYLVSPTFKFLPSPSALHGNLFHPNNKQQREPKLGSSSKFPNNKQQTNMDSKQHSKQPFLVSSTVALKAETFLQRAHSRSDNPDTSPRDHRFRQSVTTSIRSLRLHRLSFLFTSFRYRWPTIWRTSDPPRWNQRPPPSPAPKTIKLFGTTSRYLCLFLFRNWIKHWHTLQKA